MLNVGDLESQLKTSFSQIIPRAIEQCKLGDLTLESELGKEKAKAYAEKFDELVSADLAKAIASAIDYYVKNISITGNLITYGSYFVHTCSISSMPTPVANGKVPNTLGIS